MFWTSDESVGKSSVSNIYQKSVAISNDVVRHVCCSIKAGVVVSPAALHCRPRDVDRKTSIVRAFLVLSGQYCDDAGRIDGCALGLVSPCGSALVSAIIKALPFFAWIYYIQGNYSLVILCFPSYVHDIKTGRWFDCCIPWVGSAAH